MVKRTEEFDKNIKLFYQSKGITDIFTESEFAIYMGDSYSLFHSFVRAGAFEFQYSTERDSVYEISMPFSEIDLDEILNS